MTVLKRREHSGFVNWPKNCRPQLLDGPATFRTKCDMFIGPCACGHIHRETDDSVQDICDHYGFTIEPRLLAPDSEGRVRPPRYWKMPPRHICCNTLVGACSCGRVHSKNDPWVKKLVNNYQAQILDATKESD